MANICISDLLVEGRGVSEFDAAFRKKEPFCGLSDEEKEGLTAERIEELEQNMIWAYNREKYSLSAIYPVPREEDDPRRWRIANWGTRYAEDIFCTKDHESVSEKAYCISSAWSPPIDWVKEASRRFPYLKFTLLYLETGMAFAGRLVFQTGEIEEEISGEDQAYRGFVKKYYGFDPYKGEDEIA